jgi:hypothetical protein
VGEWRYLAYRLNGDGTETQLDPELPLTDVSLSRTVSGANAMSAKLRPALARLLGPDGMPIIKQWSTAIYAEESGQIRHGCIVSGIQKSGSNLDITGIGFTGAISGQPYEGSTFFVETDPLDIARHIWDHWQSFPGGNLGIQLDRKTKVGKLIGTVLKQVEFDTQNGPVSFEAGPYKLNEWETDDLGGKFTGLASDHGFDYEERHAWSGENVEHFIDFAAPRMGTRRTDLRFVVGENVLIPPSEDANEEAYASAILVRGAGTGATMKRALVPRAGEKRLRRIKIHTDNTLKTNVAAWRENLFITNSFRRQSQCRPR